MKIKHKSVIWLLILWFAVSRIFILLTPPANYSDVRADYERYANIWYYGLPPYTHHQYEYPPATIPLLATPLLIDLSGVGYYYLNYRLQIFVIDCLFFGLLLWTTNLSIKNSSQPKQWQRLSGLYIYILLTTLSRAFFYEGIDLAFTAAIFLAYLVWYLIKSNNWRKYLRWVMFWLSTAVKFLTLPLALPLFLVNLKPKKIWQSFWKELLFCGLGFTTIWGIPLAYYRTSLSVPFIKNFLRPIKSASLSAHIIAWINLFTQTESQVNKAPDFEFVGPVASLVTQYNFYLFTAAMMIFFSWVGWRIYLLIRSRTKLNFSDQLQLLLTVHGSYLFLLFITAKTFSQPFHIWYLPLIVLYKFQSKAEFWWVTAAMMLMLLLDMTTILYLPVATMASSLRPILKLIRDSFRFLPMIALFVYWLQQFNQRTSYYLQKS